MAQITVTHITDPLPDAAWRDLLGRLVLTTNLNAPANSVAPPRDIIRINAQIRDDPMPPTATQAVVNQTDKPATDQNEDPDAPMPPNPSVRSYFLVGAAQAWNVMIEHGKAAAQIMDWFDQSDQTAAHLVVAVQRINTTVHAIETVPVTYAGGRTVTYTRNRRIHVAALCPSECYATTSCFVFLFAPAPQPGRLTNSAVCNCGGLQDSSPDEEPQLHPSSSGTHSPRS